MVREHLVVQGADLPDLGVGRVQAGELAGQGVERAHHRQRFGEALRVDLRHDRAAVGQQFDQPLGREHLECLAQRRSGQAELPGEEPLVEPGAGCQAPLHDQVAEPVGRLFVEGPPMDGGRILRFVHFACRIQKRRLWCNT